MSAFENQVAIITGGRRGIGKAIALKLGKGGARIAFNDVGQPEEITETVEEFRSAGIEARGYLVDVTNRDAVQKMIEDIISFWGRIDILVNNAGITRDGLFLRMKDEDWQKVIDVCLQGTYNFTKEVLKYMVKQKYGRII
ncbi:MAG: 3-oxoacyl-[acyl-carrier protein] reductase, partial [Candidatus Atribacteria bacterium]|nr:3-oxoacyl-[acyl-carrier protein] reductase [Candidatus Atribacteria bacterium]MDI3530844.1 3-oxoacyl-[acyl-carrier protein] reductase [Candidatus Atribacteria bacterium]